MTEPDDHARRILQLEELCANQSAEIESLSEQVRQQWTRIDQLTQSLLHLRQWLDCACAAPPPPLAISGPLWLGPLQHAPTLAAMQRLLEHLPAGSVGRTSERLLARLLADPGVPARCWSSSELGRRLSGGPPATQALLKALEAEGYTALRSGVMDGLFRCNAPWPRVLELAAALNR